MLDPSALTLFLLFVLLMAFNMPIAFCIGISTIGAMLWTIDGVPSLTTVAARMASGLDSFALLAIPFFILSGKLMGQGGIARRLIAFAKSLLGALPGGLSYVNTMACMLFGAISGSSVAATSAIGGFMIPIMEKEGYEKNFSTAVTITASTTGLIIPPSNTFIVYSLASGGTSIAALFLAGYIPGILVGLFIMAVSFVFAKVKHYGTASWEGCLNVLKTFAGAFLSLLLIVIVIGGIVAGYFTATEASAVAVVYSLILTVFIYKEVTWRDLPSILLDSVVTTSVVMMLIAASMAMSWLLAYDNIPQDLSRFLLSLSNNKIVILLIINLILLVVGTFMDMTPAVLIFTPIFLPIVKSLGIHPVHFGVIMVLNLCVGLCTPPVGTVLFVGCSIAKTTVADLFKPLLPLFLVMIIALFIISYFPQLSLFLPAFFGL